MEGYDAAILGLGFPFSYQWLNHSPEGYVNPVQCLTVKCGFRVSRRCESEFPDGGTVSVATVMLLLN
jgi:hypothetical protein